MLNSYYGIMMFIASIVIFANSTKSVAIASGSILLILCIVYFVDTYVALRNTGALSPALGGQAPQATDPVTTTTDPYLRTQRPPNPPKPEEQSQPPNNYPSPLGVNTQNNHGTFDPPSSIYVAPNSSN